MISTGYGPLRRDPCGDRFFSNGGMQSTGKTLQSIDKILPAGSSGPLKSEDFEMFDVCKRTRSKSTCRQPKAVMPQVSSKPSILHPVVQGNETGVRKSSPLEAPDHAEFSDMVRNVRR